MRILFIYKDYFGRRKLYGKYLEENGHKVIYLLKKHKRDKNSVTVDEIKKAKPDLVWFLNAHYVKYNPNAVEYLQDKKIPMTFYHGVPGRFPFTDWLDIWKKFTIVFPVLYELHEYLLKNGVNSHYMPFGFHPNQYYKCIASKKYNVSFAGTVDALVSPKKDNRCRYLNSIKNLNKVVAHSISFKGKLHKNIIVKACKTHQEQKQAYSQTKINLDLPFVSGGTSFYDNIYHLRNRFFEIPATGNFMMSIRCPKFIELFPEDTVGYYDDIESFREIVIKYLKDKKIRNKMAEKSYKLAHQKHTFKHRFKEMCKILKSEL